MQAGKIQFSYTTQKWLIFLIPVLLYSYSLGFGFVLDDLGVISENKFVQQGIDGWDEILTTHYWQGFQDDNQGLYRPLTLLLFAGIWEVAPNNPLPLHCINVLIYGLLCYQLFSLLRKIFSDTSEKVVFLIVLIFACHPIHSEVVANIKSLDELLSMLFFLYTAHWIYDREMSSIKDRSIAGIIFLGALLSKESALLFLPILILILIYIKRIDVKKAIQVCSGILIITTIWFIWRHIVVHQLSTPIHDYNFRENSILACDGIVAQKATALYICGKYLLNCFLPLDLAYDYSFNQIPCRSPLSIEVIISGLVYIALIVLVFVSVKKNKLITSGIICYLIGISLASNLLLPISTTMADRLLFFPVLGIIMAVTGIVLSIDFPGKLLTFLTGLVLVCFCTLSILRTSDWKDMDTLIRADVKTSAKSAKVTRNYAINYLLNPTQNGLDEQSGLDSAVKYLNITIGIDPTLPGPYSELAKAHFQKGEFQPAIITYKKLLRLKPETVHIYSRISEVFFHAAIYDSCITYGNIAINKKIANESDYDRIGASWFQLQKLDSALHVYETAVGKYPASIDLRMNHAKILVEKELDRKAIAEFRFIVNMEANSKESLYNLASLYQKLGMKDSSAYYFQKYSAIP